MNKGETILRSKDGSYYVDRRYSDGMEFYMLMNSENDTSVLTPNGVAIGDDSIFLMKRMINDIDAHRFDHTEPASVLTYVFTYFGSIIGKRSRIGIF